MWVICKENRMYIRVEFRQSFGYTNHVNVHKLYAVEYITTVYVPYIHFNFEFFKAVK